MRICGGMKLRPSSPASALRSSAMWVKVGTSTRLDASPGPVRPISTRAASGQKPGPGGILWTVWGMRTALVGAGFRQALYATPQARPRKGTLSRKIGYDSRRVPAASPPAANPIMIQSVT